MGSRTAFDEICELNLTYLLLAQRLIREDKATAMFRFGLSEEVATVIGRLPLARIVKAASVNIVLCRLRMEDQAALELLSEAGLIANQYQNHLSIILASQQADSEEQINMVQDAPALGPASSAIRAPLKDSTKKATNAA